MKIFEEFKDTLVVNGVTYQVDGCHREWNPLHGYLPPSDSVWEVFTSTNWTQPVITAQGSSRREAMESLARLIDRLMAWDKNPNKDGRLGI
jgi:hypothetical protein